ncbi:MAG: prolipoprotein diacylglyceryl transferase [Planctomycetota bacterium]
MRPELFRIVYEVPLALGVFAFFVAVAFVIASRQLPAGKALAAALLASLTCGLHGGKKQDAKEGPDLFVPGALATLTGLLPLLLVLKTGKALEVPISGYPFSLALGFLCGIGIVLVRGKKRGIPSAHVLDLAIICLVAGPVGARIFFVAQFWDRHFADKPARLTIGEMAPLTSSDSLVLDEGTKQTRVTFTGEETSFEKLVERFRAGGARARTVELTRRRTPNEVIRQVRGVVIESEARGDAARLVASGSAAEKLGILEPGRGATVPLEDTLKIWNGGLVFYGGLILASLACVVYIRARGHPLMLVADAVAPVLALGLVFGRIGCTFNGCCWGCEVDPSFPLAIRFPEWRFPWIQHAQSAVSAVWDTTLEQGICPRPLVNTDLQHWSRWVHPVQIYGIVVNLALFGAVLLFGSRFARRQGQTFFFFLTVEPILRFAAEHFRGDNSQFLTVLGYPLSAGQLVAVATIPIGAVGFAWSSRRGQHVAAVAVPNNNPESLTGG